MKIAGYSLAFAKLQALYLSSMIKKATYRVTTEGERVRQSLTVLAMLCEHSFQVAPLCNVLYTTFKDSKRTYV